MGLLRPLLLATLVATCSRPVAGTQDLISVDIAGYRPGDQKIGLLRQGVAGAFEVWSVDAESVVATGEVGRVGSRDVNTGDELFPLDFSNVNRPGRYRIRMRQGDASSGEFRIGDDVYGAVWKSTLGSFYYQRCGIEVDNGSPWRHPPCHPGPTPMFDDPAITRDVHGGWHDAGDYNRFTVTTAVGAQFLLSLYDHRRALFADGQLNIPELGNGIPDILDEARWALEWLLRLQAEDGGVYHKVSIREWTGEHLPHLEQDTQYVFPVSSAATADAAAVAAHAAWIFRSWDPPFALRLMQFARHAWDFLQAHPTIVPGGGFRNPPGVTGGEYGDVTDADERLWAAIELFRLTGDERYHRQFLASYAQAGGFSVGPGWQNVAGFAFAAYLDCPGADVAARNDIVGRYTAYGETLVKRVSESGYRCVLARDEFYWGSNSVLLGYAYDLVQASRATGEESFLRAAVDQLHYILGRNSFDVSFVTGSGEHDVRHPYHQFSMLMNAGAPVPGMVVGGPNGGSKLDGVVISEAPGRCYEDNSRNYFVNETAINYTAPLVYLAGYLSGSGPNNANARK